MQLTDFQQQLILSVAPTGAMLKAARYFQEEYIPAPVHVTVEQPDGTESYLVLRLTRGNDKGLAKEAALLPLLKQLGLPTPNVLVHPQHDPTTPNGSLVAVYSFLPGHNLQFLSEQSAEKCQIAARLLLTATKQLAALTSSLQVLLTSQSLTELVPNITLLQQWEAISTQDSPWLSEPAFIKNMNRLRLRLEAITDALVFTNGDYQPGNFLTDGNGITGFVDFEYASFQDYLYGFAKYPIYDLHPLNEGGMIKHLLDAQNITFAEFAPRLALGCLRTLQRELPVHGGDERYRTHVLTLLANALDE